MHLKQQVYKMLLLMKQIVMYKVLRDSLEWTNQRSEVMMSILVVLNDFAALNTM